MASNKRFGLNYRMLANTKSEESILEGGAIYVGADTVVVTPPFTLEFDITQNILQSASVAQVRITNLGENKQNQLRKNYYDPDDIRMMRLFAGYGSNMPEIFLGYISQAMTTREDNRMVTTIESFDGGYAFVNGDIELTFENNTRRSDILDEIARRTPGISKGTFGKIDDSPLERGNSYSGNGIEVMSNFTKSDIFVDKSKLYILDRDECLPGDITQISSETGLLGSPQREQLVINLEMLFEPRIRIAQSIYLNSTTQPHLNGLYKVVSIKHKGIISGGVGGAATTSVGLFFGTGDLTTVVE